MPAAIDTTDGVANFASFRQVAWHGLGTVFTNVITVSSEMLKAAHLDNWNVRLVELKGQGRGGPQAFEVIRDNPTDKGIDRIGVVGARYTPVQNEKAFSFLQTLAPDTRWETAGSIRDGALVFGSIAFENEIVLDPNGANDVVKTYLLVYTSHDGTTNLGAFKTTVRVVCQNTFSVALSGASNIIKIRHTKNQDERMKQEAKIWQESHSYFDAIDLEYAALFAAPVTDGQYTDMVVNNILGGTPDDDAGKTTKTVFEKNLANFEGTWKKDSNAAIRGTAWGAWNALTENNQWNRQVRNAETTGREKFFAAGAGFDNATNKFRQDSFNLVKGLFVPA